MPRQTISNGHRAKNWCFTLNNYTEEELEFIKAWDFESLQGAIVGREIGQNGTPHLQGYLQLAERKRMSQLKSLPGLHRAHLEVAKGSPQANQEYCSKEDENPIKIGNLLSRSQGARTDLEALHESLRGCQPLRQILNDHFNSFVRYQRGITAARYLYAKKRDWESIVICYWGRTGSGKTRAVMENLPSQEAVYIHPGGPWFDGYDGQEIVLFDDFGGSEFKLTYLLKLLDRYPMQVPIKGGFVQWAPKEIYITSNRAPKDWYPNAFREHICALERRIHNKVFFE